MSRAQGLGALVEILFKAKAAWEKAVNTGRLSGDEGVNEAMFARLNASTVRRSTRALCEENIDSRKTEIEPSECEVMRLSRKTNFVGFSSHLVHYGPVEVELV